VGRKAQPNECLAVLHRARVLRISAGRNTGSNISVKFDREPGSIEERSPHHHLRPHQLQPGEARLFIECTWRLSDENSLIASSADPEEPEKSEYAGLGCLLGVVVAECKYLSSFLDLEVTFDTGLRLAIFCDQVGKGEANYSVETYDTVCTVASNGEIIVAKKQSTRRHLRIIAE
jgi:hypothetical protein